MGYRLVKRETSNVKAPDPPGCDVLTFDVSRFTQFYCVGTSITGGGRSMELALYGLDL